MIGSCCYSNSFYQSTVRCCGALHNFMFVEPTFFMPFIHPDCDISYCISIMYITSRSYNLMNRKSIFILHLFPGVDKSSIYKITCIVNIIKYYKTPLAWIFKFPIIILIMVIPTKFMCPSLPIPIII